MLAPKRSSLLLLLSTVCGFSIAGASVRADQVKKPGMGDEGDPNHGNFTLAEAVKGLPGPANGPLQAVIDTSKGKFTCELFDKQTPITVANFIGLATGKRAWLDPKTSKWVQKKPFYDGLIFHRVIPGFMIQGGDPLGTGVGNPGYRFQDEIVPELKFDKAGLLAMANAGPATNGSQFFITEGTPEHLTGRHTIFGSCQPTELVGEIARVKAVRDKPVEDVVLKKVVISHARVTKAPTGKAKGTANKGVGGATP
jgi:peptidyl-prolyl cis-trans isomerase A (cyclophilin A)